MSKNEDQERYMKNLLRIKNKKIEVKYQENDIQEYEKETRKKDNDSLWHHSLLRAGIF